METGCVLYSVCTPKVLYSTQCCSTPYSALLYVNMACRYTAHYCTEYRALRTLLRTLYRALRTLLRTSHSTYSVHGFITAVCTHTFGEIKRSIHTRFSPLHPSTTRKCYGGLWRGWPTIGRSGGGAKRHRPSSSTVGSTTKDNMTISIPQKSDRPSAQENGGRRLARSE